MSVRYAAQGRQEARSSRAPQRESKERRFRPWFAAGSIPLLPGGCARMHPIARWLVKSRRRALSVLGGSVVALVMALKFALLKRGAHNAVRETTMARIVAIKTFIMGAVERNWLFVKIETDLGVHGWERGHSRREREDRGDCCPRNGRDRYRSGRNPH